jgi:hypothetical protein
MWTQSAYIERLLFTRWTGGREGPGSHSKGLRPAPGKRQRWQEGHNGGRGFWNLLELGPWRGRHTAPCPGSEVTAGLGIVHVLSRGREALQAEEATDSPRVTGSGHLGGTPAGTLLP